MPLDMAIAKAFEADANAAVQTFFGLTVNCSADEWKEVKKYKDGVTVWSRPSPNIADKMFKSECVVDVSPAHALALCNPLLPYRTQWDPVIDTIKVVETIAPNVHLVYHVTKPVAQGLVAARDTLDVVRLGKDPADAKHLPNGTFFVVAVSVKLDTFPPVDKVKRSWQYPAGYIFEPIAGESGKCRWSMVFHTDLDMNKLASMMATMVKPNLMHDKMDAMIKASRTLHVEQQHIDNPLAEQ